MTASSAGQLGAKSPNRLRAHRVLPVMAPPDRRVNKSSDLTHWDLFKRQRVRAAEGEAYGRKSFRERHILELNIASLASEDE